MPIVELHLLEGYAPEDKSRLGKALTDAVRLVVPAPPDAITVMIHEMPTAHYYRGGVQRGGAPVCPDPAGMVRDYLGRMEARDIVAAEALLGDRFVMRFPGSGPMSRLSELLEWAAPRYRFVTKSYEGFDLMPGADAVAVVYCRGVLSGEWANGTPFEGVRFIDRFEITDGKITRQDVWNDIAEVKAAT